MAYVMEAIVVDPAPPTAYDLQAVLRYGMNGSYDGAPTFEASSATDYAPEWITWDPNTDNGIDSGWVDAQLTIDAALGQMTWSLGEQSVTIATGAFNSISQIQIVAETSAQAMMSWQNIDLKFFNSSTLVDSWSSATGPTSDQTGTTSPVDLADIVTVTPQANNVNKIQLTAQVKVAAPQGVYLDQNSVFGQVLITTA